MPVILQESNVNHINLDLCLVNVSYCKYMNPDHILIHIEGRNIAPVILGLFPTPLGGYYDKDTLSPPMKWPD